MLHQVRSVIARLAGRQRVVELDERVDAIARDLAYLKSLAMAPSAARLASDMSQRDLLRLHELRMFSQNGEDGLLLYLFAKLGSRSKKVVEIGIQDGTECNARNLITNFGWSGYLIEGDPGYAAAARATYAGSALVREAFVTRENVNELLAVREGGDRSAVDRRRRRRLLDLEGDHDGPSARRDHRVQRLSSAAGLSRRRVPADLPPL